MALQHSKVWQSLLVAGGIVLAFGVIWSAFLLARMFEEAQGAIVLVVVGILLIVISESILITVKGSKGK